MSDAPPFWFKRPGIAALALSPISAIYGAVAAWRMQRPPSYVSSCPVLCVGNYIAGGAGKTPTSIALARIARSMNLRPGFLSRGYGGNLTKPTIVDTKSHTARQVGDEPLILADYAVTVVSADRPEGAKLLEAEGVDIIIMDDGFQNPSLHKDTSLMVVDARRSLGNGFCIPAGPVRARLGVQMAATTTLLLIGSTPSGTDVVRRAARMAKPVLTASIENRSTNQLEGETVIAYCGIADAGKFHESLRAAGAEIVETRNFRDHHPYSAQDCQELLARAWDLRAQLVTTQKDDVRLRRMGDAQEELRSESKVFHIDLEFENPTMVERLISQTIEKAADFRLKHALEKNGKKG
ncbi:MAG: tetraacyldisaccharide 4'-kinase [Pseudomonadota bacterium]